MINEIAAAFSYDFMRNALAAGIFIGISCAIIGVFLVLRRFSMVGDGLAHTSLATIALGMLLGVSPIWISIPLVIAASFFILRLSQKANVWGDSAIGFVSAVSVALAVIIASRAKGFNNDLNNYLFGNILAVSQGEILLSLALFAVIATLTAIFYRDLFALSFDEDFARVIGIKAGIINHFLIALTAIVVVLGIRLVGTMLVSSLIIIPALSALQISANFRQTIILSMVFSVISVLFGILLSYVFDVPTGAAVVLLNALIFFAALAVKRIKK